MKDELAAYVAALVSQLDPKQAYRCEPTNETYHGREAFDMLFGWGDHEWLWDELHSAINDQTNE